MKCQENQSGLTLIETLIAMSISAVVLGGLVSGIYAILTITGRGNSEITALRDIQSAAYWISYDAQMAGTVNLTGTDNLTLSWVDEFDNSHSSNYSVSGTKLIRDTGSTVTAVAWNVSSVEFLMNNDMLTFNIISAPPGRWNIDRKLTGQVNLRAYP